MSWALMPELMGIIFFLLVTYIRFVSIQLKGEKAIGSLIALMKSK